MEINLFYRLKAISPFQYFICDIKQLVPKIRSVVGFNYLFICLFYTKNIHFLYL